MSDLYNEYRVDAFNGDAADLPLGPYDFTGGTGSLIAYIDLASAITSDGRDIELARDALGIIRL